MKKISKRVYKLLRVETKEEFRALLVQFIKFGLVGVSNTLVSWACYYLFLFINPDLYIVGGVVGTVVSIANAFFWNDRFVFKGNERDFKSTMIRLGKTYVSYGFTSLLSTVLLWVEVEFFGVGKAIAPIINLLITVPLNFLINKFWTFAKRGRDEENKHSQ